MSPAMAWDRIRSQSVFVLRLNGATMLSVYTSVFELGAFNSCFRLPDILSCSVRPSGLPMTFEEPCDRGEADLLAERRHELPMSVTSCPLFQLAPNPKEISGDGFGGRGIVCLWDCSNPVSRLRGRHLIRGIRGISRTRPFLFCCFDDALKRRAAGLYI